MRQKIYRIDEDKPCPLGKDKKNQEDELRKVAKEIGKDDQFLYIDISSESGYRYMYECNSSDDQEQINKISKYYRVNLSNHHTPNFRGLNFLKKMKETTKKREKVMSLVKDELNKSSEKFLEDFSEPANSTRYLRKERGENEWRSNHTRKSSVFQSQHDDSAFLSLINRSLTGQIDDIRNFQTLPVRKYSEKKSPVKKTDKYLERVRLILPGIKRGRK